MSNYKLELDYNYGECGDGCCSWDETKVSISGLEIGWYGNIGSSDIDSLEKMIEELNKKHGYYELHYLIESNEDGKLVDVIYLNDIILSNSTYMCDIYEDMLEKLDIKYKVLAYDLVSDIWKNEKRIELILLD